MKENVLFGMGCFWGAERKFWQISDTIETAVGYAGGARKNPNYDQVCSGATGHVEVVKVTYDQASVSFIELLKVFWESHNPTQGNRQGNDRGTQYRSVIYVQNELQKSIAEQSLKAYQKAISAAGFSAITTEIADMPEFWPAETFHQKYLQKNPNGYCGLGGTGVLFHLV